MSKTLVNIRVGEGQKEEWDEFVDESNEFGSLSHLIRSSVSQEIHSEETDLSDLKSRIEEMHEMTLQTNEIVSQLDSNFDDIQTTTPTIQDIERLKDQIISEIPEESDNNGE